MNPQVKDLSASVRARLFNLAKEEGKTFETILRRFFQERLLYRLSISAYREKFILKGGLLLVGMQAPMSRPTKDIDFLSKIAKSLENLEEIFSEVGAIYVEDGVRFDTSGIVAEEIIEDAGYAGVRLRMIGYLGRTRDSIQIDVGFGDVVVPNILEMDFPTLLDFDPPHLKVYSKESILAEKYEAMVKLSFANSRMKDFYDVFLLSSNYTFDGKLLQEAMEKTFRRRETVFTENPIVFQEDFLTDPERQRLWRAFLSKSKLEQVPNEFPVVMAQLRDFLNPVNEACFSGWKFDKAWNPSKREWDGNDS